MWWRITRAEFTAKKGDDNKTAMREIVMRGDVPGILAYDGSDAVGWIALAPRTEYSTLARSRILKPVDDHPVWSIVCFFVKKTWRGKGLTVRLLDAAAEYARNHGAALLEGYPVDPATGRTTDAFAYTGLSSSFLKTGFIEVARRSPTRPIMRKTLTPLSRHGQIRAQVR